MYCIDISWLFKVVKNFTSADQYLDSHIIDYFNIIINNISIFNLQNRAASQILKEVKKKIILKEYNIFGLATNILLKLY